MARLDGLCQKWPWVAEDGGKAARQCAKDGKEWRALMHMEILDYDAAIVSWFLCAFRPPSRPLVAELLERVGMRYMMRLG